MARPKPELLLRYVLDKRTETTLEVVSGTGVFVVMYNNQPFNLRRSNPYQAEGYKYLKTIFVHKGFAETLAKKLNHYFKCNNFEVKEYK